jgi:hypothetical protein
VQTQVQVEMQVVGEGRESAQRCCCLCPGNQMLVVVKGPGQCPAAACTAGHQEQYQHYQHYQRLWSQTWYVA